MNFTTFPWVNVSLEKEIVCKSNERRILRVCRLFCIFSSLSFLFFICISFLMFGAPAIYYGKKKMCHEESRTFFKSLGVLVIVDRVCTCDRFQSFYCIGSSPMYGTLYGLMESSSLLWIHIKFLRGTYVFCLW